VNHFAADLGIPRESRTPRIGISRDSLSSRSGDGPWAPLPAAAIRAGGPEHDSTRHSLSTSIIAPITGAASRLTCASSV